MAYPDALCERAGMPRVSPIDLRRSCATWLAERGATEDFVRLYLGHSADSQVIRRFYRQPTKTLLASGAPRGFSE